MEHTPGPWKAELINEGNPTKEHWRVGTEHNPIVAEVTDWTDGKSERDANARLIAAAPDLLEVLEELLENGTCYLSAIELDHNYDGEEWEKKARTAIAKAKGQ